MNTKDKKLRRQKRVRSKLSDRIRLSVFRSNKYIFAQLIDDKKGETLLSVSEKELKGKLPKTEQAKKLGLLIASKSKKKKISEVVFDRGRFKYHGRVKALAQGAREGGLKF